MMKSKRLINKSSEQPETYTTFDLMMDELETEDEVEGEDVPQILAEEAERAKPKNANR